MKSGSKYYPLFQHLQRSDQSVVELTFAEIETLMGRSLPASAFEKKSWWSNRDSPSALQAVSWIRAGYQVKSVDLVQRIVTFKTFQATYNIQRQDGEIVWKADAIKAFPPCAKQQLTNLGHWQGHNRQTFPEELLTLRLFKCRMWL